MEKRNKRWRKIGIVLLVFCMLAAGCGAQSDSSRKDGSGAYEEVYEETAKSTSDMTMDSVGNMSEGEAAPADIKSSGEGEAADDNHAAGQKLIVTQNMSVETEHFDEFLKTIRNKTAELGGYLSNSNTNGQKEQGNRNASLSIRIPAANLSVLTDEAKNGAKVTYFGEDTQDVTMEYVDVESRIKALRTEQGSLLQLLEKAESLEDIIKLQERLSEVNYEIESYESRLRVLENQVEYSTLYLDVREVERETKEGGKGFFTEIKDGFGNSLYNVGRGIREAVIGLLVASPYLIVLAVIGTIVFTIIMKIAKKHRNRQGKVMSEMREEAEYKENELSE